MSAFFLYNIKTIDVKYNNKWINRLNASFGCSKISGQLAAHCSMDSCVLFPLNSLCKWADKRFKVDSAALQLYLESEQAYIRRKKTKTNQTKRQKTH